MVLSAGSWVVPAAPGGLPAPSSAYPEGGTHNSNKITMMIAGHSLFNVSPSFPFSRLQEKQSPKSRAPADDHLMCAFHILVDRPVRGLPGGLRHHIYLFMLLDRGALNTARQSKSHEQDNQGKIRPLSSLFHTFAPGQARPAKPAGPWYITSDSSRR